MKIYPLGYNLHGSKERVEELMSDPAMLIVDCRITPWSWRLDWCRIKKDDLSKKWVGLLPTWGNRYKFAGRVLGNVKHPANKDYPGEIEIELPHDADRGISRLIDYLNAGNDLILLCQCPDFEHCHLKVVVERLIARMPVVEVVPQQVVPARDTIPCLSVRQPYASWLANPQIFVDAKMHPKTIENRDWQTSYRGPLLIHASKGFEQDAFDEWDGYLPESVSRDRASYPAGAIIGIGEMEDCIEASSNPWFVGDYGWMLQNARPLEPIPYKGALRLFDVPRSLIEQAVKV